MGHGHAGECSIFGSSDIGRIRRWHSAFRCPRWPHLRHSDSRILWTLCQRFSAPEAILSFVLTLTFLGISMTFWASPEPPIFILVLQSLAGIHVRVEAGCQLHVSLKCFKDAVLKLQAHYGVRVGLIINQIPIIPWFTSVGSFFIHQSQRWVVPPQRLRSHHTFLILRHFSNQTELHWRTLIRAASKQIQWNHILKHPLNLQSASSCHQHGGLNFSKARMLESQESQHPFEATPQTGSRGEPNSSHESRPTSEWSKRSPVQNVQTSPPNCFSPRFLQGR